MCNEASSACTSTFNCTYSIKCWEMGEISLWVFLAAARSESSSCLLLLPRASAHPHSPHSCGDTGALCLPRALIHPGQAVLNAVQMSQPISFVPCNAFPCWREHPEEPREPTWQPRAARRKPSTVGDAGAAPVTIMRTHPPRLACWIAREKKRKQHKLLQVAKPAVSVSLIQSLHEMLYLE